MTRYCKILPRTLFMRCFNMKSLPLNKKTGCLLGLLPSPLLSLFLFSPPSLLIIPLSHRLSSLIHLLPAGPHFPLPFGGSLLSFLCPVCPPPVAAWTSLLPSVAAELKSGRPSIYCLTLSHDCCLSIHFSMTLLCKDSLLHYAPEFGFGSPDSVSLFLNVVDGVGGGRLLGLPWHVIRAFVKERLAMSAFSFCQYGYPSASWGSDCKVGTIPSREDSMVRALGCLCTGWKRGVVGTLSCTDRIGVGIYYGGMAQAGDNARLLDIEKNLSRLYEMTAIGVMDNKEMAKEIKSMSETVSYTSLQVSNHDARIDDNESNLSKLLGKVDRIQEDFEKLITMNQGSRDNGVNEAADHPMEEESVVQPRALKGNP